MKPRPKPSRKTGRRNRIAGQFCALPLEMLRSPAWRVLSLSARRVLDRVSIELRHHAGNMGIGLCVTFDDFEEYGIHRHSIAPAIREVVALSFLRIARQGRAGNADFRQATLHVPTFEMAVDCEPTHDWRQIKTLEQAKAIAAAARGKSIFPAVESAPTFGAESATGNDDSSVVESITTAVAESTTTIETLGRDGRVPSHSLPGSIQHPRPRRRPPAASSTRSRRLSVGDICICSNKGE